ncbi:MAG: hypothetical protein E7159_02070 [Firmicutes bacterium]|jgi:translocator assembly and maintenance protein 41|nr:hypothetical protein [Bacillota bacterium]
MEEIREFIKNRPDVRAAYGYGSKIFKQENAITTDSLIDLIFVVDNIKEWHLKNLEINPKDYSLIGSNYFKIASADSIKGSTGIAYISDIEENGLRYKFGTIEYKDLYSNLQSWKSFYVPGRFQKTIYPYKEDIELNEAIMLNRKKALLVATYLAEKDFLTKEELFETLVNLSYMGDPRMKIGETPEKVKNIVQGAYDEFNKIYNFDTPYFEDLGDSVAINTSSIINQYNNLPLAIREYINNSNNDIISNNIRDYLTKLNHDEAWEMMLKAPLTNGVVRSAAYGARKLKKGINGRIEQMKKTA